LRGVFARSHDKTLKLWDVATAKEIRTFTGHSDRVWSVAFSPDGRSALSLDWDDYGGPPILKLFRSRSLKLWDVAKGTEIRGFFKGKELRGLPSSQISIAFSPDGRTALSGSFGKTVTLWNLAGGSFREFELHDRPNMTVAFSPDGRSALSGTNLWDVATGKEIHSFTGHADDINSVTFSPDGRNALSGSDDKTLKLRDVAAGKELRTFRGHTAAVNSVAFSPNGRNALSGSDDKTLKLWDVATGKEIRTFMGHTSGVTSVAVSPDGRNALSGSRDDTLKLWDVRAGH
jgi:WD40 repeat protein